MNLTYILRRLGWQVVVIVGLSMLTFGMIYILPADPARTIAGTRATAETIASIRQQLGLDQPLYVQYLAYAKNLLQGDLGYSYRTHQPVLQSLLERLPATFELAFAGLLAEILIGLPVGALCALRRGSLLDRLISVVNLVGLSLPQFWVGLFLLYYLAYLFPVFPLGGRGGPINIVLPALTLGITGAANYSRLLRRSLIEVMHSQYVTTARAKGCQEPRVVLGHAFKNAIIPVFTMIGMDFGYMMAGVIMVEQIFGWPGIGELTFKAIVSQDIPLIMGAVLFISIIISFANALVDILYPLVNPMMAGE